MFYQFQPFDDLLITRLTGVVDRNSWISAFTEAERICTSGAHKHLLLDGSGLTGFDITHSDCQKLAVGFLSFIGKSAFFSNDPLAFGMMRVVHSYSNNESFRVFKTCRQAVGYLGHHPKRCFATAP